MKIASVVTLGVALFVASMMLTAAAVLSDFSGEGGGVVFADLEAGNLWPMFCGSTFWSRYPGVHFRISFTTLVDLHSLLLVGGMVATTFYVLRIRLRRSFGLVSIVVLTLGTLPYMQGAFVLQANDLRAAEYGSWLAVMIMGVLYASLASAVLATMELTPWHLRLSSRLNRFCRQKTSVAPRQLSGSA